MSAYYHMDLESFALAPKKGIEESLIQILLFAISYSYHAYLIFDNFLGITTLFSHVQGAQKSAWICDKIAKIGHSAFSMLKGALAWKKYTTDGSGGGD